MPSTMHPWLCHMYTALIYWHLFSAARIATDEKKSSSSGGFVTVGPRSDQLARNTRQSVNHSKHFPITWLTAWLTDWHVKTHFFPGYVTLSVQSYNIKQLPGHRCSNKFKCAILFIHINDQEILCNIIIVQQNNHLHTAPCSRCFDSEGTEVTGTLTVFPPATVSQQNHNKCKN